jgi:tetrahydromethanopterin S-methyltransferase subunit G
MSAHPLDIRMAHLEGAYEQVSKRLDGIDRRLDSIEQRMDKRFSSLEGKIDRQFLWVVGLLVVSIILPIADRFATH